MGPVFTPPVVSKVEGPLATLVARLGRRRDELAGRLLRSGNTHVLYVVIEQVAQSARPGAAARSVEERSRLRAGQCGDRRATRAEERAQAPSCGDHGGRGGAPAVPWCRTGRGAGAAPATRRGSAALGGAGRPVAVRRREPAAARPAKAVAAVD